MWRGNGYHPGCNRVNGHRPFFFRISPMEPTETIYVTEMVVACDGGKLGHPRVYLNLTSRGEAVCPYCSRRFILKTEAGKAEAI